MYAQLRLFLIIALSGAPACYAQSPQAIAPPLLSGRLGASLPSLTTGALLTVYLAQSVPTLSSQALLPDRDGNYHLSLAQEAAYRAAVRGLLGGESDPTFSAITFVPYKARSVTLSTLKAGTSLQKAQSAPDPQNPGRFTLNINPNFWANPNYSRLQSRDHFLLAVAHEIHHVKTNALKDLLSARLIQIIKRETGKSTPLISNAVYFALDALIESDADDAAIQLFAARTARAAPSAVVKDMRRALKEIYRPDFERHRRQLKRQGVETIFKKWVPGRPALDGKVVVDQALLESVKKSDE